MPTEHGGAAAAAAEDWSENWSEDRWVEEARKVRTALELLGETVPQCLPGEPQHSGEPIPVYYATWLALVMARARTLICLNTPDIASKANDVYNSYSEVLKYEFIAKIRGDV